MGSVASKNEGNAALILCKERTRYIKQAIDSRNALSAAQLAYTQSLRNTGTALRHFVEAELSTDSCLSASEAEKSPSHSSYCSPSPSRIPELVGSPAHSGSPFTPRQSNVSYMRAGGSSSVKITVDSAATHYVEDDSLTFPMPPPLPDIGSSWDFFDPIDALQASGENGPSPNCGKSLKGTEIKWGTPNSHKSNDNSPLLVMQGSSSRRKMTVHPYSANSVDRVPQTEICEVGVKPECGISVGSAITLRNKEKTAVEKEMAAAEREDPSDFITHRAKGFLSSIKDIEHRFTRASECGQEVSRMLETSKIRLGTSETIGEHSASTIRLAFQLLCCKVENTPDHDAGQEVTKVITWNRKPLVRIGQIICMGKKTI